MKRFIATIALLAAFALSAAAFTLEPMFSDGMVLAKGKPIRVFGEGEGRISVSLAGKRAVCQAVDGRWEAVLPAMKAGGPYRMTVSYPGGKAVVEDVYIGTVIIMAGQSNIQFKLKESSSAPESWKSDPLLREFTLPRLEPGEPYTPEDGWVPCRADDAGNWSAIGYLVGNSLRRENEREAVGIINCYQGASVIESWIPEERIAGEFYHLPQDQIYRDHYHKVYGKWNGDGFLYHYTLEPLLPYAVSAVVWYQGESNTGSGEAAIYPLLARELVLSWREAFKDPSLPFTIVQIADYVHRPDPSWKAVQEAQLRIPVVVPGVTVVKSADVCETDNIHPKTKEGLSERIAGTLR